MKEALTYDDVLLVPQYSDIKSRKEVDISSDLDEELTFDLPIISSPMDTVTESEMAYAISKMGGLGIIHRYNSIEEQAGMVAEVVNVLESKLLVQRLVYPMIILNEHRHLWKTA